MGSLGNGQETTAGVRKALNQKLAWNWTETSVDITKERRESKGDKAGAMDREPDQAGPPQQERLMAWSFIEGFGGCGGGVGAE